jgi:hypothetical protein
MITELLTKKLQAIQIYPFFCRGRASFAKVARFLSGLMGIIIIALKICYFTWPAGISNILPAN